MSSPPRASTSIIVAGIFAIIGGAFGAFFNLSSMAMFSLVDLPRTAAFPVFMRPVMIIIGGFFLLCAIFVMVVGVQVIRLRNWARISLLVIAGCLLFFGVIGIGVIFFAVFATPLPDPRVSQIVLVSILALTYGIPIAISIWWLVLFTRSSIAAQFHAAAVTASGFPVSLPPATPAGTSAASKFPLNKPNCPLAVRIVGWYLASFILFIPLLPFTARHFPALFFGHVFRGPAAVLVYFLSFTLLIVPGFGLLLLKRWSYPLAIAGQLVVCANGIFTGFSPAYKELMRSIFDQMNMAQFPGIDDMLQYLRYFNFLGLVIPIAILITLLLTRRQFFAAANAESPSAVQPSLPHASSQHS